MGPTGVVDASALSSMAPLASPTFTGVVRGITGAMVGLGSVDDTSDASKPVSVYQTAAFAPIAHVGVGGVGAHSAATESVAGFMSATDKVKLDGIAIIASPMTTMGDTTYGGANGALTRLPVGPEGTVITVTGGKPGWAGPVVGPAGTAASITMGTIGTGPSGTLATSTNTGTSTAAVLNFVIPRGADGVAGLAGPNAVLIAPLETLTIVNAPATGTIHIDIKTSGLWYYPVAATANFTVNVRGDGATSLNSILTVGQSVTVVILVTNGVVPYYPNIVTIDGVAVLPMWSGGLSPSAGNSSATDSYSFVIMMIAPATFKLFSNLTKFA